MRPAPTSAGSENKVIPGDVTVTPTPAAARTPGAVAFTVVEPAAMGLKATPPDATDVGVLLTPAGIVAVRVWPAPPEVTSSPTAAFVLLTVTVRFGAPARRGWYAATNPPLFSTPSAT